MADTVRVDDDGGVYVGPDAETMDIVFRHNEGDHSKCPTDYCQAHAELVRLAENGLIRRGGVEFPVTPQLRDAWDELNSHARRSIATGGQVFASPSQSAEQSSSIPLIWLSGVPVPVAPQMRDAWHELNSHQRSPGFLARSVDKANAVLGSDHTTHATAIVPPHADQPLPVPNGLRSVQCMVREDLVTREQVGRERYGTSLQPFNGRDSLRDAYEEVLDLACYLRQMIAEREAQPPPSHTVWVVVSDCGMNGLEVHAVLNADPGLTHEQLETKYLFGGEPRGSLPTGYAGTWAVEMEVSDT